MVKDRLSQDDTADGFLLDGFPRTVEQGDELTTILNGLGTSLDAVIQFDAPEDVVVGRMLARGRADDTEDVVRTRLKVYRDETSPLLDYYKDSIIRIVAEGTVDDINARTMEALRALNS